MRLIVRSSSWLNDTLFLLTAWNSLIGIATNPKLIVPLHTGLGMGHIVPHLPRRETEAAARAPLRRSEHDRLRRQPEQDAAGVLDRRRGHGDVLGHDAH